MINTDKVGVVSNFLVVVIVISIILSTSVILSDSVVLAREQKILRQSKLEIKSAKHQIPIECFSDICSEEEGRNTATSLIRKLSSDLSKNSTTNKMIYNWEGSKAGRPLLVHNSLKVPVYYIVPILNTQNKHVGLIGVDANTGCWQWYTEEYKYETFPIVSASDAIQAARQFLENKECRELAKPKLVSMPDKKLYWTFEISGGDDEVLVNFANITNISIISTNLEMNNRNMDYDSDMCLLGTGSDAKISAPPSYDINITHYYQWTPWYCGEAAMDMVFDYYGPRISQRDIGDVANEGPDHGTYSDDLRRSAHFSYLSTAIQNPDLKGYEERKIGYGAFENWWSDPDDSDPDYPDRYTDLKNLISSDYPIILLTYYDGSHGGGHYRVVKGYDDTSDVFIVHDPWNTAWSGAYGGPNVHFKQSFLVDDLWDCPSNRWGLFVHPWNVTVTTQSTVEKGITFALNASITYPCPDPFDQEKEKYGSSNSQATIELPTGYSLAEGESATKTLDITSGGTSDICSWQVIAPSYVSGPDTIVVNATGRISGSSDSYSSYTDEIGGNGSTTITVEDTIPSPPMNIDAKLEGETLQDVNITWDLSIDDPDSPNPSGKNDVKNYTIYYNNSYDKLGNIYKFLVELPKGTTYYVHENAGDGDPNNYSYYVQANDTSGNTNWTRQAGKIAKGCVIGWNFISDPYLGLDGTHINTVLRTLEWDITQWWDPTDAVDHWKCHATIKPDGFNDLPPINRTMGLWVNITKTGGDHFVDAGRVYKDTTIQMYKGWNLVSYASFIDRTVGDALSGLPYEQIEGFDETASPYYLKILAETDIMKASCGYWIKVSEDCTWTIEN